MLPCAAPAALLRQSAGALAVFCLGASRVLWPALPEAAARNNLNVSIHALRRALAAVGPPDDGGARAGGAGEARPAVCHEGGAYRLDPALAPWVDRDVYLAHLARVQAHLSAGNLAAARTAFHAADALREGDLFADVPYCDWLEPRRREVRDALLEAGDALTARLYEAGDIDGCLQLARRVADIDPCNEHMQRRVMRCYARRDQHHLALRQFLLCRDALARELDTIPGLETVALFDRLRRRQPA